MYVRLRISVNLLKRVGMVAAGLGLSGAIGAVSSVLLLYVLIDATIAGADEVVWLYLCAAVGVIVGGICFRVVLWAGKPKSILQ